MYFELVDKKKLERFIGLPIDSIRNLEDTSAASNGKSVYLVKAKNKNGKHIRYYFSDYTCHIAENVFLPQDISCSWQGFLLACLEGSDNYTSYFFKCVEYRLNLIPRKRSVDYFSYQKEMKNSEMQIVDDLNLEKSVWQERLNNKSEEN